MIALVLNSQKNIGGAKVYEKLMIDFLKNMDIPILLYVPEKDIWFYRELSEKINILTYSDNLLAKSSWILKSILKRKKNKIITILDYIDKFKIKLSQRNVKLVYFLSPNLAAISLDGFKIITTVWDFGHKLADKYPELNTNSKKIIREFYYKKSLATSDLIVVDSDTTKKDVIYFYKQVESKILTLHFSSIMPTTSYENDHKNREFKKYIIYPSSYWPHKNHKTLIQAFLELLKASTFDVNLYLIGASTKYFKTILNKSNLNSSIIEKGVVDEIELKYLIRESVGLVMPTALGPTNLPIYEALCMGVPVIMSNAHEQDECIESGAIYVSTYDVNEWTKAMMQILTLPPIVKTNFKQRKKIEEDELVVRLGSLVTNE